jgi:hypothetical protein
MDDFWRKREREQAIQSLKREQDRLNERRVNSYINDMKWKYAMDLLRR